MEKDTKDKIKVEFPIADAKQWLEQKVGKKLIYGQKPSMLDLSDEIIPDKDTPVDVLLAIIGKRFVDSADDREWLAFKWMCGHIGINVDQAIEVRTFADTH